MNAKKRIAALVLLCAGMVYLLPALVVAGPVPANVESVGGLATTGKLPGAAPGATTTSAVSAYAWDKTNNVVGDSTLRYTAAGTTSNLAPIPVRFTTTTYPGGVPGMGDNTRIKLPNTAEIATSTTGTATGRGEWQTNNNSSTLSAEAVVSKAIAGYAAGYASDPYLVSQGSYSVAPAVDGSLLLQTNPADPTSEAGIIFSAQSIGLGDDNANLWTLAITEIGNSSPVVSFTSAPILGLDDGAVVTALGSALDTSIPGTVQFKSSYQTSGYTLFSTTLSAGTDFYFGDAFEADASNNVPMNAAVPEPASLTLLGIGAVALAGYAWRCRKRSVGELSYGAPLGCNDNINA